MKTLTTLLVFLATLLVSSIALGKCDKGDVLMGPNCVHTVWVKEPQQEQAVSKVYRVGLHGKKTVVWGAAFGEVTESTDDRLVLTEWSTDTDTGAMGLYTFAYTWDGKGYSGRTQID